MANTKPNHVPSFDAFQQMKDERDALLAENQRLRDLLDAHNIAHEQLPAYEEIAIGDEATHPEKPLSARDDVSRITKYSSTEEKIALYMSLFRGREDVYARQWPRKDGTVGYSPACKNEWIPGVCGKPKVKCASCSHAVHYPYDDAIINRHLRGDCTVGIYPLLQDDAHF